MIGDSYEILKHFFLKNLKSLNVKLSSFTAQKFVQQSYLCHDWQGNITHKCARSWPISHSCS